MATARSFDQQTSGPPPTHPQHDAKTTPSSPPTHPSTNAGHNGHGQGPGRGAPTKMHGHVNLSRACGAPSMRATGGCERARNDTKMRGCCCSRRIEFHPTPRAGAISGIRACSWIILKGLKPLSPDMDVVLCDPIAFLARNASGYGLFLAFSASVLGVQKTHVLYGNSL